MTPSLSRSRSGLARCLFAALCLATPGPAAALDFGGLTHVYSEDYEGETAFPTTPELDVEGYGGAEALSRGNGPPPLLQPSGGGVTASPPQFAGTETYESQFAGVLLQANQNDDGVGARGHFSNLGVVIGGAARYFVDVEMVTTGARSINAQLLVQYDVSGFPGWGVSFFLSEVDPNSQQAPNLSAFDGLSVAAGTAILTGAPFAIDLHVSGDNGIATGTLEVDGEQFSAALTLNPGAGQGIASAAQVTQIANCETSGSSCNAPGAIELGGPGEEDQITVTYEGLDVYVGPLADGQPVPAPGLWLAAGLVASVLSAGRRAARRPARPHTRS